MAKKSKKAKRAKNPYANMVSGPMEKGNDPKKKEKGDNLFAAMKKGKKG